MCMHVSQKKELFLRNKKSENIENVITFETKKKCDHHIV